MRATFTVEVPDEFVVARARRVREDEGLPAYEPHDFFRYRCEDIAQDDLLAAFRNWPVTVTLQVDP